MTWTILIIKKSNNSWFVNYIEKKLINQIIKYELNKFINVVVFENNQNILTDYVSVIDTIIDISDDFLFEVYNKIKYSTKDCIGLKGVIYVDDKSFKFNNEIKCEEEEYLPITKFNPIKSEIILKNFSSIYSYINSDDLSSVVKTIDNINKYVVFLGKTAKKTKISIIITAYKSQEFIEECLDSIENQTYFKNNDDFEVLIGVDGCKKTLNKINSIKYKYRNLVVYMMSENKGTYITTNTLLDLVKYDDIIRFDSDDIMKTELVKEIIKEKLDSDIVLFGSLDLCDGTIGKKFVLSEGPIYFKKSVMDNVAGGYQPWSCAADSEFIMRIGSRVKISTIKKVLFYRRIHRNSLTQNKKTKYGSKIRKIYESQIKKYYSDDEIKIDRVINDYNTEAIKNNINYVNINNYFDCIYCLNLDKRIGKWLLMKKKFDKLNIKVQRFSAIDGEEVSKDILDMHNKLNCGAIGCMLSHYDIIKDAKKNKYNRILIFEDDVILHKNFNSIFSENIKKIKNKWKLIHFGASQYDWSNIDYLSEFYYSKNTQGTFNIGVDSSIYDEILETEKILNVPIDTKLCKLQEKYYNRCYTFFPNLSIADVSTSDIRQNRDINEHSIKMKWNINLYNFKDNYINILLFVDIPGWAFDNIATAIIKYNTNKYIKYTKMFIRGNDYIKNNFSYDEWDYVYVFFEGDKNVPINKNKLVSGCYAAMWLESEVLSREYLANKFDNCRATIFVNDDIKNQIIPHCKDICYTTITDSSDENIFYKDNTIEKYDEFTVLFVGNTERKIKRFDSIKRICDKSGVKLKIAKNIPNNELYKEYNKSHLCINFSVSEGGPQTIFESSLCETPMLINSDITISKNIPCFSSSTESGMINILNELKNNKDKCLEIGKAANKIVLDNYTYEKTSKKFSDFFFDLAKNDILFNNDITVFVISCGYNPNFDDCIGALNKQTIKFKIDIIKDYSPSSMAFQEMINRCNTKYYIQVDEDMVLFPFAIETMYNSIKCKKSTDSMISFGLHDVHLNFDIIGIKIFKHEIFKKYPYDTNIISDKIPSIEQLERVQIDGYTYRIELNTILGFHSPKWDNYLIFERYFDLIDKYKTYKYEWLKDLPIKLENMYNENPNEINYYAMMGAKCSLAIKDTRKIQKNFKIKNDEYFIIKKYYELKNIKI